MPQLKTKNKGEVSQPTSKKSNKRSTTESEPSEMLMELLVDEIKDIYWAEKQLVKSLPKMVKASTTDKLRQAFSSHLEETKIHVSRLEDAFKILGKTAQAKKCEAMAGLTKEAEEIISDTEKGTFTRDVALIMAAQKVEHYEIATYGSLVQLAKTIGNSKLADLLARTLLEEKKADELLTVIAENNINVNATEEAGK